MPITISIEGNIGAGKTTFINKIENLVKTHEFDKKICVLREPVDIWTDVKNPKTGETILQSFYRDPKTYAFPFQTLVFNTRLMEYKRILKENPDCDILFCERSLECDSKIFAKMLYDDGLIDDMCYEIYKHLYETSKHEFPIDKVFFLGITHEECSNRIKQRAREGEESIPLEYLEKCNKYHIDWLNGEDSDNQGYEIARVYSPTCNLCNDDDELLEWLRKL